MPVQANNPRVRNPQTGEVVEYQNGQWVPVDAQANPVPGVYSGMARAFRQGGTFGWGDELTAAVASNAFPLLFGDKVMPGAYERIRSREEGQQRQFAQDYPATNLAANVAGGAASGLGMARAIPSAVSAAFSKMPGWLQGATVGASAGGLAGAGESQPGERGQGATMGAIVGGGLGMATDLGAKYGGKLIDHLRQKYFQTPTQRAGREVLKALESEGLTTQDALQMLQDYGDDAVLADVGGRVRSLAAGVEALPEAPRRGYEQMLRERHGKQQDQLMGAIQSATGRHGETLQYQKALEATRKGKTAPLYKQAYQTPTAMTDTLSDALSVPEIQKAYRRGHQIAQLGEEGKKLPMAAWDEKLQQWTNPPTTMEWDWIQRGLRAAQQSNRINNPAVARAYGEMRTRVLDELDNANPVFKEARTWHASGKQIEEALEEGKAFFSQKDGEMLTEMFGAFSYPEKAAYMNGVVKAIRGRLMNVGKNKDITTASWLRSPEFQDRMVTIFGQDAADEIFKQVDVLAEKAITKNQILHQSMTADKTAVREALQQENLGDAVTKGLQGDITGAVQSARRAVMPKPEVDPQTAAELATMLLSPVNRWQQSPIPNMRPLSPFWQRRAAGMPPTPQVPLVAGEQAGLLQQWFNPYEQ
jgi:hypothetical protein